MAAPRERPGQPAESDIGKLIGGQSALAACAFHALWLAYSVPRRTCYPAMARIVTTTYRYRPPPKRKGRKLAQITGPAIVRKPTAGPVEPDDRSDHRSHDVRGVPANDDRKPARKIGRGVRPITGTSRQR